jgi:hypothetical protein
MSHNLAEYIANNLINDEYEDSCYNLAYSTEPTIVAIINLICGNASKTVVLKKLLNNRELYNKIFNYNECQKFNTYKLFVDLLKYKNVNIQVSNNQMNRYRV